MKDAPCARLTVVVLALAGALQACGNQPRDAAADVGVDAVGVDAVEGCPGVPCSDDLVCIGGECVEPGDACVDDDGDGFGPFCDEDDCDDTNAEIHPGRPEVCNDVDDDCDFYIDEDNVCAPCSPSCAPGETFCSEGEIIYCDDSSGCARFGDAIPCPAGELCRDGACIPVCVDRDTDGYAVECDSAPRQDCDDARSDVYPGAPEVCDGVDNNCDGRTDENFVCDTTTCEDTCEEGVRRCTPGATGYIDCIRGPDGCARPTGVIPCPSGACSGAGMCVDQPVCVDIDGDGAGPGCDAADCRPLDPNARAGASETCNGLDDDCDGVVDDGGVCASCVAPTADAPEAAGAGTVIHAVGCGGYAYYRVGTAGLVLASSAAGPPTLERGRTGGGFVRTASGFEVGSGSGLVGGAGDVVRVRVDAGVPYTLVVQSGAGACAPDTYADNSPAAPATAGVAPFGAAASLCAADFDFSSVTTRPGQIVSVQAIYDSASGANVIASVWRNGIEVTPSFGAGMAGGTPRAREAWFRTDLPGEYVAGVRGFLPSATGPYALTVETLDGGRCRDDGRETTDGLDDDTLATARVIGQGTSVPGTICPGDFDIIRLGRIEEGRTLTGRFEPAAGAEIEAWLLYDGWSARRDFPSAISATGTYYVAIFGTTPTASGDYTIEYAVR